MIDSVDKRSRWRPLLLAIGVVYGPFLVAAIVTWTTVACDHCKLAWLQLLWVFPGLLAMELPSAWGAWIAYALVRM